MVFLTLCRELFDLMLSKLNSGLGVSVTVRVCLLHNYVTDSRASLGVSAHRTVSIIILSA